MQYPYSANNNADIMRNNIKTNNNPEHQFRDIKENNVGANNLKPGRPRDTGKPEDTSSRENFPTHNVQGTKTTMFIQYINTIHKNLKLS